MNGNGSPKNRVGENGIGPADAFAEANLAVVHDEANPYDAVVPPIVQTSLFTFSSYAEMEETYRA
jgi:hypothetical protein